MNHCLWAMRVFYDRIMAHLLIPQLVAQGHTIEILTEHLATQIANMFASGCGFNDAITFLLPAI